MSSARLASVVKSAKLRENDRVWFPRWLDAYRRFCDLGRNDAVPVHRELLVAFLRQEKARGRRAWQRLQIVRAVEPYRNAILGTAAPVLKIRMILRREDFEPEVSAKTVARIEQNKVQRIQKKTLTALGKRLSVDPREIEAF